MYTIYKYDVEPGMRLSLPATATVLTVQMQFGKPVMWVLLDPDEPECRLRTFVAYGTGHEITEAVGHEGYIGTFQTPGGLVFHLFEVEA